MNREIRIYGMRFVPPELHVEAGDSIVWTNDDTMPHSATADDGSYDTGLIAPGTTSSPIVMANPTPRSAYHCKMHTDMHGWIQVK